MGPASTRRCGTPSRRGAGGRRPGSGLGLAIVRDLAALYGGSIALDRSPLAGLRASLDLPFG
jgi:signal transduction histidine kinase